MLSVTDPDGRVGIDFGVYGVPETFVIDRRGVIRYKQIGAITRQALEEKILPLVRELQRSLRMQSNQAADIRRYTQMTNQTKSIGNYRSAE